LPPVSVIPVVHLDLRISPRIFETVLMGYSGAGGKLIHEKTRSKISRDTVPLKGQSHDRAHDVILQTAQVHLLKGQSH
jgi:hypothetical protein